MKSSKSFFLYILSVVILLGSCEDDKEIDPSVKTVEVIATSAASATARGSIDEIGNIKVLDYGFEYNSSQKISLGDQPTKGAFETEIAYSPNTYNNYLNVRAYLTNEKGTVYGESIQVTFPTIQVYSTAPMAGKSGDRITILGSNFSPNQQDNRVMFNDTYATVVESSTTKLVAEVPASISNLYYYSGTRITVKVGNQTLVATESFKLSATATDFSPKSGNIGTLVTLIGSNFANTSFTIFVDGTSVSTSSVTNASVSFYIPSGVKKEKLKIDFVSNSATTTLPGEFSILAPEITSYTPKKGIGGSLVTITGKNFMGSNQYYSSDLIKIKLGTISCTVQSASTTEIKFIVPKEVPLGTQTLSITTPIHTVTATDQFTLASPKITSFSPTSAIRGTYVTINGENFGTQSSYETTVLVGTTSVTIYSWTETAIRIYIPTTMTLGSYKITVNNGGQSSTSADNLTVTN